MFTSPIQRYGEEVPISIAMEDQPGSQVLVGATAGVVGQYAGAGSINAGHLQHCRAVDDDAVIARRQGLLPDGEVKGDGYPDGPRLGKSRSKQDERGQMQPRS